jgi:RNA polymerase sigma factor (sigma-70 family)
VADPGSRFEEIYDGYSGLILAYASRRTANADDAADVLAETYMVAWRRINEVPPGEDARPWLYGVARLVLANHHRGQRRRQGLDDRLAANVSDLIADAALEVGVDHSAVAAAFAELAESDRELLTLVGWDQLDRDEIAVIIGSTRAVVRLRLHRARRRFDIALNNRGVKRFTATGHEPTRWANARPGSEDM